MLYPSIQHFLSTIQGNCLLLARHGETDWNSLGLVQGQQDRPLSPMGYQQRKNLFFRLFPVPIQYIFTSNLQRTVQTALPISEEKDIAINKIKAFNEAKLGVFEGENKLDFSDSFSEKMYSNFLHDEVNVVLPGGGENLKMVHERIKEPLKKVMHSIKEGNVLLVAHRNVNKMILKNLLGLTFEEGYHVEHKNDWLYIFFPDAMQLFLVKIGGPTGTIAVISGYETIGAKIKCQPMGG